MSVLSLSTTLRSEDGPVTGWAGAAVCAPCLATAKPGALPSLSCASHAILSAASSGSAGGGALYCCHTAAPVAATPSTPKVSSTPRTTFTAVRPGREERERRDRDEGMARHSLTPRP